MCLGGGRGGWGGGAGRGGASATGILDFDSTALQLVLL